MIVRLKYPIAVVTPPTVLALAAAPSLYPIAARMTNQPLQIFDRENWAKATTLLTEAGNALVAAKLLSDFKAICDATVMTPEATCLRVRIFAKNPMKAVADTFAGTFSFRRLGFQEIEMECEEVPQPDIVSAIGALA